MRTGLKIILIISGLSITAWGLLAPIYAIFVEEIGGDLLTAGSAYSIYSLVAGFIVFFISRFKKAEKSPETFIVIGYGLGVIGFAGYLFVKSPVHLFIVQLIFGLSEAIRLPSRDALFSKLIGDGKYAVSWGLWWSLSYIIAALAALIGGYLAQAFGFRVLFYVMLASAFTGFLISLKLYARKSFSQFLMKG
jgi:MFS family permease